MITEAQRAIRQQYIGSSDAAAVCGLSPYGTAYDVWAMKTGRIPPKKENKAMHAGRFLERAVLDWWQEQRGDTLSRDQLFVAKDNMRIANVDALLLSPTPAELVEAKTNNVFGYGAQAWDDGPPIYVVVQVHHQMSVLDDHVPGIQVAYIPVFMGGRGFEVYTIQRSQALIDQIRQEEEDFYINHILTDVPPAEGPSMDVAKVMRRVVGKMVDMGNELIEAWDAARKARLAAAKEEDAAKEKLVAALGDAEGAICPAGTLLYREQARSGYTVEPTTFRSLSFKKNK